MATKVTKHIGPQSAMPSGVTTDFTLPNAFDNWLSTQDLVAQDVWVDAQIHANFASADIANMEMHPLTYDATHYCVVRPGDGKGVNELDPTGALDYGTVGIELTIQANTTPRMQIGCGVFVEGFRIRITEPSAPSTTGQYGIMVNRKTNSSSFPNTVPGQLRKCRILSEVSNAGNGAVNVGNAASLGDVVDNVFFQATGAAPFLRVTTDSTVARNTFIRRGTSTGTAISSNALAPKYRNNAFSNCSGIPITLTADASTNITNNFTDVAKTNSQTGLTYATGLIVSNTDARPVAAGPLINAASVEARGTQDIRGNNRGQTPDVGAVQLNAAIPSPTGSITSLTVDGQTVSVSFSTANTPTSGMASLRAASSNPDGAVDQADKSVTLGSNTGSVSFANVPSGNYTLTITLTNAGGTNTVSGQQSVSILGVSGGGTITDTGSAATRPAAPTNVTATAGNASATVNCTPPSDGGSAIINYIAIASTGQTGSSPTLPVTVSVPNNVAVTFQMQAVNAIGASDLSAPSNSVTPTGPVDTTPPVMVGSLSIQALSQSSYTITWQAATDNVGVTGYEFSTDGVNYTDIGMTMTRSVTGLAAQTTHQVRVRAYDAASNKASPLATTVTTLSAADVTDPVLSGNMVVSSVTANTASVSWPPATDNIGVLGYEFSFDGGVNYANIGNTTTYSMVGLIAGTTYALRVRAFDAAGNHSTPLSATLTTLETNSRNIVLDMVTSDGVAMANQGGLHWAWFDQVQPHLFTSATDKGNNASTNAQGQLILVLPNSTLQTGAAGWLVVTNSDGNPATEHSAFSGPVTVR